MKEQLISFETAKIAKEKGFNWVCEWWYVLRPTTRGIIGNIIVGELRWGTKTCASSLFIEDDNYAFAPSQSLLQRWLREYHNMHILICLYPDRRWFWKIEFLKECPDTMHNGHGSTYEQALEGGLQEALKLIDDEK